MASSPNITGRYTLKNEGVTGSVWASGQPLMVQDYRTWNKSLPEFIDAGFNAVMGVPLKVGDTVIGVLAISYVEQERTFTQEQVSLMERFAALAALAIDNTRLYELAQKEFRNVEIPKSPCAPVKNAFARYSITVYIAIAIVTLEDGTFLEANDAFWELSGLQPEKALGSTSLELDLWDEPQERSEFVRDLLEKHSL